MKILGTKFFGHDSAIALIDTDLKTIFAMSTERVTRIKHDWGDVTRILDKYNIQQFDYVCHSFSNFNNEDLCSENKGYYIHSLKCDEIIRSAVKPKYIKDLPNSWKQKIAILIKIFFSSPTDFIKYAHSSINVLIFRKILNTKKYSKSQITKFISKKSGLPKSRIKFYDHHLCHATAAYYLSPHLNLKSLSLTIDGQGDGSFSKLFLVESDKFTCIGDSKTEYFKVNGRRYVTSIGDLYGNFTEALGFRRNSDEGKVEALAAFNKETSQLYNNLMDCVFIENLSIKFDLNKIKPFYDNIYLKNLISVYGQENVASSIQCFLNDSIVMYLNAISEKYPDIQNLCLSGGVAANIILNLNIYERTNFKKIYILPPMGDEGTAIGSAVLCAKEQNLDISWINQLTMPYYGDEISEEDINSAISTFKNKVDSEYLGGRWAEDAAKAVASHEIISIVNGQMEFGPRALGNRSIVASPMSLTIKEKINSTIKKRPWFQPFCPSILEDERELLFQNSFQHKHMATAFRLKEKFKSILPGLIHVDGTARPQFVSNSDNEQYFEFLQNVKKLSGYGAVINTSFNLHGRTIVRTAEDAIRDYIDCNLDHLYMNGYKITKKKRS